jgi:hypothetical protein
MSSGRPTQSFEDFGTAAATLPTDAIEFKVSTIPGMVILAVRNADGNLPDLVGQFLALLEQRKLPRLAAVWRGTSNCHNIVDYFQADLARLGIEAARKLGFCGLITEFGRPVGLHSWVEIGDCVIDTAGGGSGIMTKIMETGPYYLMMKMSNIRDRAKRSR